MQKFRDVLLNAGGGGPIASVQVTVNKAAGGLATIYSDNGVTVKSNPFTTGADGGFAFYARNGRYTVSYAKTGFSFASDDLTLFDPREAVGLNPLEYGTTIEAGVTAIQAAAVGTTISNADPVQIYIGPGIHTLTAPITIARHNVTLTIDGGAKIVPATNQAAILFDPTGTPEGYIKHWGLFLYGVIYGNASGANQHGVVFDDCVHGTAFLNEIRALGGSGMVFDGSCFSNVINWNRIHGVAGWGINSTGANNHNESKLRGEVQAATLGGANLWRWTDTDVHIAVENMSGGVPGIKLDSCRGNRISTYFENGSNNAGDDIVFAATTTTCDDNVLAAPCRFKNQKTGSAYNINIPANTVNRLAIRDVAVFNATTRILNVGSGNTGITVERGANIPTSAITNAAGKELRLASYLLDRSGTAVAGPADTNENIVATIPIPKIGQNGLITLTFQMNCTNNANAKTVRTRLNGVSGTIHGEVAMASQTGGQFTLTIRNRNAVNSQAGFLHGATNTGVIKVWGYTTGSVDTDAAPDLVITFLKATGGDTMTLEGYTVEILPGV